MSRKSTLILFDVDGTLTQSRLTITKETQSFYDEVLKPEFTVGIVGGSDLSKITEQIAQGDESKLITSWDYVFAENGLVGYKNGECVTKESISNALGEDKCQDIINFALDYLSKIRLPVKRGNFVEFRNGLINISPPGRSVSHEHRLQFFELDKKEGIRQGLANALMSRFKGIQVSLGGQISIDVFPENWDKRFCLKRVCDMDGFKDIYFFGDKTSPGGNDYEIFEDPRTKGFTVISPEDTIQQLKKTFNL
uniref:Phosphomannomutase n=1 Tax=Lepeophtheirus salmonis TaxID=72036 RepID=D3PK15_LEPSM|nr:Phosphomannomutase 1 [Lepeophtheirus salmonis]